MRLSVHVASGWRSVAAGGLAIWVRETIRQALNSWHERTRHEKKLSIAPLSDTWLRRLEEESSKHVADW